MLVIKILHVYYQYNFCIKTTKDMVETRNNYNLKSCLDLIFSQCIIPIYKRLIKSKMYASLRKSRQGDKLAPCVMLINEFSRGDDKRRLEEMACATLKSHHNRRRRRRFRRRHQSLASLLSAALFINEIYQRHYASQ